jgi:hypothetical protein
MLELRKLRDPSGNLSSRFWGLFNWILKAGTKWCCKFVKIKLQKNPDNKFVWNKLTLKDTLSNGKLTNHLLENTLLKIKLKKL